MISAQFPHEPIFLWYIEVLTWEVLGHLVIMGMIKKPLKTKNDGPKANVLLEVSVYGYMLSPFMMSTQTILAIS